MTWAIIKQSKIPTFPLSNTRTECFRLSHSKKKVWFLEKKFDFRLLAEDSHHSKTHKLMTCYVMKQSITPYTSFIKHNNKMFQTFMLSKKVWFHTTSWRFPSFMNTNDTSCHKTVQNPHHFLCQTQQQNVSGFHTLEKSLISDYWLKIPITHKKQITWVVIKQSRVLTLPLSDTTIKCFWFSHSKKKEADFRLLAEDSYHSWIQMTWECDDMNSPQSPTPPFLSHTMTVEISGLRSLKKSDFELLSEHSPESPTLPLSHTMAPSFFRPSHSQKKYDFRLLAEDFHHSWIQMTRECDDMK